MCVCLRLCVSVHLFTISRYNPVAILPWARWCWHILKWFSHTVVFVGVTWHGFASLSVLSVLGLCCTWVKAGERNRAWTCIYSSVSCVHLNTDICTGFLLRVIMTKCFIACHRSSFLNEAINLYNSSFCCMIFLFDLILSFNFWIFT